MKKIVSCILLCGILGSFHAPISFSYSSESVYGLVQEGIIVDKGDDISQYNLQTSLTRQAAIKIVIKSLDVDIPSTCKGYFQDVNIQGWSCKYIEYAADIGLVSRNTNFRPFDTINLGEFIKLLLNSRNIDKTYNTGWWQDDYIQTAQDYGIRNINKSYDTPLTRGDAFDIVYQLLVIYEDNSLFQDPTGISNISSSQFESDTSVTNFSKDPITRQAVLKILIDSFGIEIDSSCRGDFQDVQASNALCPYVEAGVDMGLVSRNTLFRPYDPITEAEMQKLFVRSQSLQNNYVGENEKEVVIDDDEATGIFDQLSDLFTEEDKEINELQVVNDIVSSDVGDESDNIPDYGPSLQDSSSSSLGSVLDVTSVDFEGFADTKGGAGGKIVYVTNLNNSGNGSLRWALEDVNEPRVVLFAVEGKIDLRDQIVIDSPYVTLAGQSAPGDGVVVTGARLSIQTNDVIIQGMKIRPGDGPGDKGKNRDAIGIGGNGVRGVKNVVIDHNSLTWAVDETIGLWGTTENITISNNIIAEALHDSIHVDEGRTETAPHSTGLLIGSGPNDPNSERITVTKNLFVSNQWRNPFIKESYAVEFTNNYIKNHGVAQQGMNLGGDKDPQTFAGINNVYESGKDTGSYTNDVVIKTQGVRSGSKIYLSGNTADGKPAKVGGQGVQYIVDTIPFKLSDAEILSTDEVKKHVLRNVGARVNGKLDHVDMRILMETVEGTTRIIDSQKEVGGYDDYNFRGRTIVDADKDGITDEYDSKPTSANSFNDDNNNGVTNLEEFLYVRLKGGNIINTSSNTTSSIPQNNQSTIQSTEGGSMITTFELEDATSLNGFEVVNDSIASGGKRLDSKEDIATAEYTFLGTDGVYDIHAHYCDEDDGNSLYSMTSSAGLNVSWNSDRATGENLCNAQSLIEREVAQSVVLNRGDKIVLSCERDGREPCRIDKVTFKYKSESTIQSTEGGSMITTFELEDATSLQGFVMVNDSNASGGKRLDSRSDTATAEYIFSGSDGVYDIHAHYCDEDDGNSSYSMTSSAGLNVSWNSDRTTGENLCNAQSLIEREVAQSIVLSNGDNIVLSCERDGREPCRIDKITFELQEKTSQELSLSNTTIKNLEAGTVVGVFQNGNLIGDDEYSVVMDRGTGSDFNEYFTVNSQKQLVLIKNLNTNEEKISIRVEVRDGVERFDKIFILNNLTSSSSNESSLQESPNSTSTPLGVSDISSIDFKGFADTKGGAGGDVIYVTNTNNSGRGSLRWALEDVKGPRTVLFKVEGIINLQDEISIKSPYLTLAGQSAPGEGVVVTGGRIVIQTHDVIVQGMKIRPGDGPGDTPKARDAISIGGNGIKGVRNIVIDHNSLTWAVDESLTIWGTVENVTISNNIIGEALHDSIHIDEGKTSTAPHSMGIMVGHKEGEEPPKNVTITRNILVSNSFRNPYLKGVENAEVVNNYIYNHGAGHQAMSLGGAKSVVTTTIINNVIEDGKDTSSGKDSSGKVRPPIDLRKLGSNDKIFINGNYTEGHKSPAAHGKLDKIVDKRPFTSSNIEVMSTDDVKKYIFSNVGARVNGKLDNVDTRILKQVLDGTSRIIDSPDEVGGYTGYNFSNRTVSDRDNDGIPDEYDSKPTSPNPHSDDNQNGVTNLEEFLYTRLK